MIDDDITELIYGVDEEVHNITANYEVTHQLDYVNYHGAKDPVAFYCILVNIVGSHCLLDSA